MALRRNQRLRREYLYAKSLEGKEKDMYERKQRIKAALAEGKPIPTELRAQVDSLKHAIELEHSAMKPRSSIDDEYDPANLQEPKVCVTTSREPSGRLKQFAKEVRLLFPNSQRVNRGTHKIEELVSACRGNGFTDVVVVHETRGEPDGLIVSHLPHGLTVSFSLSSVVLRHDIEDKGTMSEAFPHLIMNNFKTKLGERIATILKHCFPVPKPDSKRVLTFSNDSDYISFRHHTYTKAVGSTTVELKEVGPRFELRPYRIMLGALDQPDADDEWVMRPYMNTARKKDVL